MKYLLYFKKVVLSILVLFVFTLILPAREELSYQLPPQDIVELAEAPRTPMVWIAPGKKRVLILEFPSLPPIEELAQPELKLAGLRLNPRTNGPSAGQAFYLTKLTIKDLKTTIPLPVTGLPVKAKISDVSWSPDGEKIAFTVTSSVGIELWMANAVDGKARKLTEPIINGSMFWQSFVWLSDSKHILYKSILKDRGTPPEKALIPKGPVIQSNETERKIAPVRTYRDLLKNRYDEKLFTYYMKSQLMMLDLELNEHTSVGKPGIFYNIQLSPDNSYIMTELIKEPYSYLVPFYYFPREVEIWDIKGELVKEIARIPLAEEIPTGFDAARKGPRSFGWRADFAAQLYWCEAQDQGDPEKKAEIRDKIFFLNSPFTGDAIEGPALKYRFSGIRWGNGKLAIISQRWWKTRQRTIHRFQPDSPSDKMELIFQYSWEDKYKDPGSFVMTPNQFKRSVLLIDKTGKYLYLKGQGASPQGNRPFLDKFDLTTKKTIRLWQSRAPYYETIIGVINFDKKMILTRREGKKIQPNYYLKNFKTGKLKQLTFFPHPFPKLKDISKQLIRYKRDDGVELTGNLYLPPGHSAADRPLPLLIWAYPQEFKSKYTAGQVTDSPYRFTYLNWWSAALWVTQGYAVFNRVSMPIIGEGNKEPNDTYIPQLIANAKAAIDKLADMGIIDSQRVGIGGHSYGAFMVGNLLAHSRLFAAGIARSGAYNRTLTPFGFQREERTLWEALDTYIDMSPFMFAHQVKDPLLLIHGEADNNSGTFPIQSKRFYHALKGHGAIARLVMLPLESHGYSARESILHVLWETYNWLEKYVKNKK